jgi:hypothetical protein
MGEKSIKIRYCDHCQQDFNPVSTHTLRWDRKKWTLDLCNNCLNHMEGFLYEIPGISRRQPDRDEPKPPPYAAAEGVDLTLVREWALKNGIKVSQRGRIDAKTIDLYKQATNHTE